MVLRKYSEKGEDRKVVYYQQRRSKQSNHLSWTSEQSHQYHCHHQQWFTSGSGGGATEGLKNVFTGRMEEVLMPPRRRQSEPTPEVGSTESAESADAPQGFGQPQQAAAGVLTFAAQVKEFGKMGGTKFTPTTDHTDAETWLRSVERVVSHMVLSSQERALLVAYHLEGEAQSWWDLVSQGLIGAGLTWEIFRAQFRTRFVPQAVQVGLAEEFASLTQGTSSVAEYTERFTTLSKYAPELVVTEEKKSYRFVRGFSAPLHDQLLPFEKRPMTEIMDLAIRFESSALERQKRAAETVVAPDRVQRPREGRTGAHYAGRGRGFRGRVHFRVGGRPRVDGRAPRAPPQFYQQPIAQLAACFRCGREGHIARDCVVPGCFACGQHGHMARECPGAVPAGQCYACGEVGHFANRCPQRPPQQQQQQYQQRQQPAAPEPDRQRQPELAQVPPRPQPGAGRGGGGRGAGRGRDFRGRPGGRRDRGRRPPRGGHAFAVAPGQQDLDDAYVDDFQQV